MKITLTNGTELYPYVVNGIKRQVQGATRDTLSFHFPADAGLAAMDELFTATNCENIIIEGDKGEAFVHKGYTIRAELGRKSVLVQPETAESEAVFEERIIVTMAQRTWQESQILSLTETVDALVLERLMA